MNDNLVWDCVGWLKLLVSQLGNFVLGIRNMNLISFQLVMRCWEFKLFLETCIHNVTF